MIAAPNVVHLGRLRDSRRAFLDRADAGRVLSEMLASCRGTSARLFAIPAGGVPVAVVMARALDLPLDVVIVSKITLPWNTEAGFGAVAFDGTARLNHELIELSRLGPGEVEAGIAATREKVRRRAALFRGDRPFSAADAEPAILVDDGLASGVTMETAVEALRRNGARRIAVAVPTGHLRAIERLAGAVETLYCANVRDGHRFAVADAYERWSDVSEEDALRLLNECRAREERTSDGRWEHFAHEADMGVRGRGRTREQAFEQAALALTAVVTDPASVEPTEEIEIRAEAPDEELLFTDWLNQLVHEMATRKMLFGRFRVELSGRRLHATAWGEKADVARHHPAVEIKGATNKELRVGREDGDWVAQTVVDV